LVPKPKCILPDFISLQPENQIKLISHIFSTTRNPDQADQPYILYIPGINGSIRTEKAALPSPSAYCIYLPSPAYHYYPTSVKDLKRISAKFRPGQDSNQERARRLTPTRAMPLLKFDV
jgi:hypothetical protein